ncbi:MAG TPA: DUF192 domain-containing protein [Candidatus Margulisiibacteriota bacterium]|nr:DUF192 domain-containing protein [Candidatus Margulisiibacteriota bacterium]
MKITNNNKGSILAEEVILADTPAKRIKGLLGKKEEDFSEGQALILKPCNSIHTFFMNFTIDALFVDQENRVIKVLPYLRPFRLSPIIFQSLFVVELPVGVIQATHTQEGDYLTLE